MKNLTISLFVATAVILLGGAASPKPSPIPAKTPTPTPIPSYKESNTKWLVVSTDDWSFVDKYLKEGWEPFAVIYKPLGPYQGTVIYYLRRER